MLSIDSSTIVVTAVRSFVAIAYARPLQAGPTKGSLESAMYAFTSWYKRVLHFLVPSLSHLIDNHNTPILYRL